MSKSRTIQGLLGALLSLALLIWLGFALEWSKVLHYVSQMQLLWLVPILLVTFLHYALRAWRWKFLLDRAPQRAASIGFFQYFDPIMVGNLVSYILPLRAGEVLRPVVFAKLTPYTFSAGFVSVIIERFFDLSAVLLSLALVTLLVGSVPQILIQGALSLAVLGLLLLGFIIACVTLPTQLKRLANVVLIRLPAKLRPKLERFFDDFLNGASALRQVGSLPAVLAYTFLVWTSCFLAYHLFFCLFGIEAPYYAGIWMTVVIALAVAAPSAPGFVGVYESACVLGFRVLGYDAEHAAAYALVSHALQYVLFILYGIFLMLKYNLSFSQLRAAANVQK